MPFWCFIDHDRLIFGSGWRQRALRASEIPLMAATSMLFTVLVNMSQVVHRAQRIERQNRDGLFYVILPQTVSVTYSRLLCHGCEPEKKGVTEPYALSTACLRSGRPARPCV